MSVKKNNDTLADDEDEAVMMISNVRIVSREESKELLDKMFLRKFIR